MTLRTFWIIVIKIFGILLIIESVVVIPQSISSISYLGFSGEEGTYIYLIFGIVVLLLYLIVLKLFVYNPGWLIDKFKLDKGFPEEIINLNINTTSGTIISIASIILGGVLFIEGLPLFCKQLFVFYQEDALSGRFGDKHSTPWLIVYGIHTFLGYLIVTNHRIFANYIDKQSESAE